MRGFLSGVSLGAVVSVLAAAGLSVAFGPVGPAADRPADVQNAPAQALAPTSDTSSEPASDDEGQTGAPDGAQGDARTTFENADPDQTAGQDAAQTSSNTAPTGSNRQSAGQGSLGERTGTGTGTALPSVDAAPQGGSAPDLNLPVSDSSASARVDTAPAAVPQVGSAARAPNAPEEVPPSAGNSPANAVEGEAPVYPSPQAAAPHAPPVEGDLSISTNPAQPAAPKADALQSAFPAGDLSQIETPVGTPMTSSAGTGAGASEANQTTGEQGTKPDNAAADRAPQAMTDAPQSPAAAGAQTGAGDLDAQPDSDADQEPGAQSRSAVPDRAAEADAALSPRLDPAAGTAPKAQAADGTGRAAALPKVSSLPRTDDPVTRAEAADAAPQPAEGAAESGAAAGGGLSGTGGDVVAALRPKIGKPAGTLGGGSSLITQRNAVGAGKSALSNATTAPQDETAQNADIPRWQRYAEPFENPEGKPLMSIVLIDDGKTGLGRNGMGQKALGHFPYPISIAIDTAWDGAAQAAEGYRNAGYEVLALTDLPPASTAADTEVAMSALLRRVPQAVAVIEGTGNGLQGNRDMSLQLASILSATEHGLILESKGLNSGVKIAADEGVPTTTVFRDVDAEGQDPRVIRRFLDHAAFHAAQDGEGVVIIGRLRADTISALHIWGQADRAERVALAPISAILKAAAPE